VFGCADVNNNETGGERGPRKSREKGKKDQQKLNRNKLVSKMPRKELLGAILARR
jgi:hypothetical protein